MSSTPGSRSPVAAGRARNVAHVRPSLEKSFQPVSSRMSASLFPFVRRRRTLPGVGLPPGCPAHRCSATLLARADSINRLRGRLLTLAAASCPLILEPPTRHARDERRYGGLGERLTGVGQ